jgi:exopolyphosphatase/guanosine-5'-triphosphate,3'-diphosphate pyrophosphatase
MRRASIDLGTNTCLLLIAEYDPSARAVTEVVSDTHRIVRLGQGVDRNRMLTAEAKARTLACLKEFVGIVRKNGIDPREVVGVATSQARDAKNGAEFFHEVEKATGFQFRTLTGEEEARYTFLGALLPGQAPSSTAVIDIGGGSTEFMAEIDGRLQGKSLDLGSVRFHERFLKSDPVTDAEFWACEAEIDRVVKTLGPWRAQVSASVRLVGVAGTVTTVGQWFLGKTAYSAKELDGLRIHRGDVHRLVEELKFRTVRERMAMTGIEEGRADVLLAGTLILWRVMEILGFAEVTVSTRGLRFGVLR